jgi:hypothetical protein
VVRNWDGAEAELTDVSKEGQQMTMTDPKVLEPERL